MAINNAYISLNQDTELPVQVTCDDSETFGILMIETNPVKITTRPVFILFTLDATGSMNEYYTSNNSKLHYAVQTLKSIMNYLVNIDADILIQINTFNSTVNTIVEKTKITKNNSTQILEILDKITANDVTNIELALQNANENIVKYQTQNPTHECVHIFMTDGEATRGATSPTKLRQSISNEYMSINIGFGNDHNATMLRNISEPANSEYHFIDKLENATIVYGESLHKILYPCLKQVTITIANGTIYNWKKNTWSNTLTEPVIVGDVCKYYHVKTCSRHEHYATIYATHDVVDNDNRIISTHMEEHIDTIPDLIPINPDDKVIDNILIKFAYRHAVLELLYESQDLSTTDEIESIDDRRIKIKALFNNLTKYMEEHELADDMMLKQLCNDLYITYWNSHSIDGNKYIIGRFMSQGSQSAYTPGRDIVTNTGILTLDAPPRPELRRYNQFSHMGEVSRDSSPTNGDLTLPFAPVFTCYSSPSARATINSIRQFDEE